MRRIFTAALLSLIVIMTWAQGYRTITDISYTEKTDDYARERLKLDIYYPETKTGCPVIVWFHGGGIEAGNKEIPEQLKEKGYVVVSANYRLLPKVTIDKTLDDAAEAVAWVFRHASEYGGDPKKIVVTGHSAGGYLGMLLCLNKASKQPASVRIVIEDIGRRAVDLYLKKKKQRKQQSNHLHAISPSDSANLSVQHHVHCIGPDNPCQVRIQ